MSHVSVSVCGVVHVSEVDCNSFRQQLMTERLWHVITDSAVVSPYSGTNWNTKLDAKYQEKNSGMMLESLESWNRWKGKIYKLKIPGK